MKTILIVNIIVLTMALIGVTIFFALWLKSEAKMKKMQKMCDAEMQIIRDFLHMNEKGE